MNLQNRTITLFGGSGFIGKSIVQKLAREGALVRVAIRNPQAAIFLKSMGEVGQITPVAVHFSNPDNLALVLSGSDAVINLVGQLYEKGSQTFDYVHVEIPKLIAQECQRQNIQSMIHVSALGADPHSASAYARSKGKGELELQRINPNVTLFRPSLVFGPDDHFFNRFAAMASLSPFLPVFGGGLTKFQPVYVEDLAQGVLAVLKDSQNQGKIYELGGPDIYTFKELLEKILVFCHRNRYIASFPMGIGTVLGKIFELFPNPFLTADQIKLLKVDNVMSDKYYSFKDLNINPQSLNAIVPPYLARFKPRF